MKQLIAVLTILLIFSCSKKEVKLPVLAEKGIQEIQNHSQVWMFFKVENNDTIAEINRKNTISTTHWLYNIDKRLPMKKVIQPLKKLKEKHHNSMHSEDGMDDFFSYSDTISKKLSFLPFTQTDFKTDNILSKYYIKEFPDDYKKFFNVNIVVNPNNIWMNDTKLEFLEFKSILLEFIDFSAEGSQTMLHLNYNEDITYQDFLHWRSIFFNLQNEALKINPIEFVFNPKKVPDCGCD